MKSGILQLTLSQQDIYFDQIRHFDNPLYNIGGYLTLANIDVERLRHAQDSMVRNHQCFGLRIGVTNDGVGQYISDERNHALPLIDFSDAVNPSHSADQYLDELIKQPFVLEEQPLYRACLLKLSDNNYRYVCIAHHLIIDGWGFSNLCHELSRLYNHIDDLSSFQPVDWNNVVDNEQQYRLCEKFKKDKGFWLNQPHLSQPAMLQSVYRHNKSSRYIETIDKTLSDKVTEQAKQLSVGASHLYMALVCSYFSKAYGRPNLRVGLPVHNRRTKAEKSVIGVFSGINPLVVNVDVQQSYADLARQVMKRQRSGLRHQRFPIGLLQTEVRQGETGQTDGALYDVVFNYLLLNQQLLFAGSAANMVYLSHDHEPEPVKFNLWQHNDGSVEWQIDYHLGFFDELEIKAIATRLTAMLTQAVNQPHLSIAELSIITEQEKQQMLGTKIAAKSDQSLHSSFERFAVTQPNAIAVVDAKTQLDYQSLNEYANAIAKKLIAKGVTKGDCVAVSLGRDINMVIAVLAILKAGGAYVPLDPKYPKARLQYIIQNSKAAYILADQKSQLMLNDSNVQWLCIESWMNEGIKATQAPEVNVSGSDLAYLIYTSGSTGNPKAVAVTHANVVALMDWAKTTFSTDALNCMLASTSLNFDLSVFELFAPLSVGGSIYVANDALDLVESDIAVTFVNTVPSAAKTLLENKAITETAQVLCLAGEPLPQALLNQLLRQYPHLTVYNLYGPTEATVYATFQRFDEPVSCPPTIGKAVKNTRLYVVDEQQNLVSPGLPGQLYITGNGVSAGYLGNADLTHEKFIKDPFDSNNATKVYKTGDLVRQLSNGELAFLGRIDDQIKVRGFRVEPGEIEFHLQSYNGIEAACVVARLAPDNTQVLVAFIVANNDVEQSDLIAHLKLNLAAHMMPSHIERLDVLPLSANGKVDKNALRALNLQQSSQALTPCRTPTEQRLAIIWAEFLALEPQSIGADQSFLTIGGHSLQAVKMRNKLNQAFELQLSLADVFQRPEIRHLAELVDNGSHRKNNIGSINKAPQGQKRWPLSYAQQNIFSAEQVMGQSGVYNMSAAFEINGLFDVAVAEQAFRALVQQHQILRCVYRSDDQGVWQQLVTHDDWSIEIEDISTMQSSRIEEIKQKRLFNHGTAPFDLSCDPMLKVSYLNTAQNSGLLLCNLHHIAADGWSLEVLLGGFAQYYQQILASGGAELEPLALQYQDFVYWQRDLVTSDVLDDSKKYWQQQLLEAPRVHGLIADRSKVNSSNEGINLARCHQSTLPKDAAKTVLQQAQNAGVTPFVMIHALLTLVLSRNSNSHDIVIGTALGNRHDESLSQSVGCFINPVALRVDTRQTDFSALLDHVRQVNLDAQIHQRLPFEQQLKQANVAITKEHAPLFQIMLTQLMDVPKSLDLGLCQMSRCDETFEPVKYDLNILAKVDSQGFSLQWQYDGQLFDESTIERFAEHFSRLMCQVADDIKLSLTTLDIVTDAEQLQLLYQLNQTHQSVDNAIGIHQYFERFAQSNAQGLAVSDGQTALSYSELNQKANRLARLLIQSGAQANDVIGICTMRSVDTIVLTLAVLKAGMSYLPLDPDYPIERLKFICKDAKAKFVVGHQQSLARLGDGIAIDTQAVLLELSSLNADNLNLPHQGSNNAYVIYTSGSTGQPKGVACRHESLINLLQDSQRRQPLGINDRCSLWCNTGFDASVYEIFSALCYGAALDIMPSHIRSDDAKLFEFIVQQQITAGFIPAFALAGFERFLQTKAQQCLLKRLLVGVEPIKLSVLNSIAKQIKGLTILNGYGPSEATVMCSVFEIKAQTVTDGQGNTPIGYPTDNTRLYIFDENQRLCPKGVIGELYVAGVQVANGYLHNPRLSAERFVANPYINDETLYRTGDLVRWNENDQLVFAGRADDQVKVRGYRIEIGEIAAQLRNAKGVEEANVVVKGSGSGKYLAAFALIPSETDCLVRAVKIKTHLQQHLPSFMVPAQVLVLNQWPLLPNGKVDKKALAALSLDSGQQREPETELEKTLSAIWADLLQIENPDVDSHFFELGGNSLHLAQMVHKIDGALGLSISAKALLENNSIAQLAAFIEHGDGHKQHPLRAGMGQDNEALSVAEQRIWLVEQVRSGTNQNNITGGVKIQGELNIELVEQTINHLVSQHKILRTQYVDIQGQASRVVVEQLDIELQLFDLRHSLDEQMAQLLIQQHGEKVLPLDQAPLMSALLLQLSDNVWRLQFNFHHMVFDGWSAALFIQGFFSTYGQLHEGKAPQVTAKGPDYDDYVVWQNQFLQSAAADEQRQFWQQHLFESSDPLNLPVNTSINATSRANALHQPDWLDDELCQALESLAQRTKGSLYTLVHSALALVLSRLGNAKSVCIGSAAASRHIAGVENIIGNFINILPAVTQLDGRQSVAEFMQHSNATLQQIQANQDLPFEQILAAGEFTERGQAPFEVFLNMLNLPQAPLQSPLFDIQSDISAQLSHKFDLTFYIKRESQGASIQCQFNNERFDYAFIERLTAQLACVLRQFNADTEQLCSKVSLHLPQDSHLAIQTRATTKSEPKTQWQYSVVERLAQLAQSHGDSVALQFQENSLSYQQLHQASDYYADALKRMGVDRGGVVVIAAERNEKLIIAIMAVLKCAGVFAILNKDQLAGLSDLVDLAATITLSGADDLTTSAPQLMVTDVFERVCFEAVAVDGDTEAYLAMTSGSEGLPKLISGSHGSLNAYVPWVAEQFGFDEHSRFAMLSGLTHDPLLRDIFTPLSLGATLYIASEQDFELNQMAGFIERNKVNVVNLTPSLAHYAFDNETQRLTSLTHCLLGGEPVSKDTVAHLHNIAPKANLIGLYGATETGRALAYVEHLQNQGSAFDGKGQAVLGKGINDVEVTLLDVHGHPSAIGEVAEIYLTGPYLSLGYANDPSLSAQKFEFSHSVCRYKTGDLGRLRQDGQIEFVGRQDRQLKLRGFRIEPAQIEAVISAHEAVERTIVRCIAHDTQTVLVAFVLAQKVTEQQLVTFAKSKLATHLLPQRVIVLEQLPLSHNGKLNEKRLVELSLQEQKREIIAPRNTIENELVQMWQSLLERQDISVDDNFFDIGGHSLLATRFIARLKTQFALSLNYQAFFNQATIAEVAAKVEAIELSKQVKKSGAKKKRVSI